MIRKTILLSLTALLACSCKDSAEDKTAADSSPSTATPTPVTTPATPPTDPAPADGGGELDLEKDSLKFGFIKLTDCAPIVIAKEKGFFENEGLQVEVIAQPNWKTLLDNVISGELDGAHMLSGQPIAATIGFGTVQAPKMPGGLSVN